MARKDKDILQRRIATIKTMIADPFFNDGISHLSKLIDNSNKSDDAIIVDAFLPMLPELAGKKPDMVLEVGRALSYVGSKRKRQQVVDALLPLLPKLEFDHAFVSDVLYRNAAKKRPVREAVLACLSQVFEVESQEVCEDFVETILFEDEKSRKPLIDLAIKFINSFLVNDSHGGFSMLDTILKNADEEQREIVSQITRQRASDVSNSLSAGLLASLYEHSNEEARESIVDHAIALAQDKLQSGERDCPIVEFAYANANDAQWDIIDNALLDAIPGIFNTSVLFNLFLDFAVKTPDVKKAATAAKLLPHLSRVPAVYQSNSDILIKLLSEPTNELAPAIIEHLMPIIPEMINRNCQKTERLIVSLVEKLNGEARTAFINALIPVLPLLVKDDIQRHSGFSRLPIIQLIRTHASDPKLVAKIDNIEILAAYDAVGDGKKINKLAERAYGIQKAKKVARTDFAASAPPPSGQGINRVLVMPNRFKPAEAFVMAGGFFGPVSEFERKVETAYADGSPERKYYRTALAMAKRFEERLRLKAA